MPINSSEIWMDFTILSATSDETEDETSKQEDNTPIPQMFGFNMSIKVQSIREFGRAVVDAIRLFALSTEIGFHEFALKYCRLSDEQSTNSRRVIKELKMRF